MASDLDNEAITEQENRVKKLRWNIFNSALGLEWKCRALRLQ